MIINEVYESNNPNQEWIEFLVTTDITLGALDSFWFGDANSGTTEIQNSSRFDSAEIISNVAYFTSTSDIVKAGTIIVVGNSLVVTDFSYNPVPGNPSDNGAWNLVFSGGIGYTTTTHINLDGGSDVVWVSSSQPTNSTDTAHFVAAIAYLNSNNPYGGGLIADFVTDQSAVDPAFQTVHTGPGGGYDGGIRNTSLSNLSGASIDFRDSESTGSLGIANGGGNTVYIESLRAVPEPRAIIPLALLALAVLRMRCRRSSSFVAS